MPKLTKEERIIVKSLVATLSLRRLPENEIIKEIEKHTNKSFSRISLYYIKQEIKKDSYEWYMKLRSNQYEYLSEFKERINEILWLQQKHNQIIKNNEHNPTVQQTSLAELHKLNITLANYFDVAPEIINGITLSTPSEAKENNSSSSPEQEQSSEQSEESTEPEPILV